MAEYDIILIILGVVVPIISTFTVWKKFKSRLNTVRAMVDAVDDAIYDDKITEKEFQRIWTIFLNAIQQPEKKDSGV